MYDDYFIVDIETCPINLDGYNDLEEEEKTKLINPIDSKIIALGIRYKNENKIFMNENEKEILSEFWNEWNKIKKENPSNLIVGFNIVNFDIPFITSRSFIHNIKITPFILKLVIDLREKINAYRYGKTRGKLTDYGKFLGLDVLDIDGNKIAELCIEKNWDKIKEYLVKDLEITEELFKRAKETNILNISRW
jgi:DNA polymerase elongation subunit (family B)|tara:strand:+ start:11703 stop:12281 length:579 start_codon:yes stop_codon:yes gene_type:complete